MARQGHRDDSRPEMIVVYGVLSVCWCVIGVIIGLSL
jgi:hypothetical protein